MKHLICKAQGRVEEELERCLIISPIATTPYPHITYTCRLFCSPYPSHHLYVVCK